MRFYTLSVAWIVVAIIIAHLLVPSPYAWTRDTISALAAQGYEQAWIMRLGFIGFGALIAVGAFRRVVADPRRHWPETGILLYGMAILLAGVFSTEPFQAGLEFSHSEARVHSILATSAGIMLSLAMLGCAMLEQRKVPRILHLSALTLTMLLSFLVGAYPQATGVAQRLLYLVGFGWLINLESLT